MYVAVVTVPRAKTVRRAGVFAAAASAVQTCGFGSSTSRAPGDPGFVTDDGRRTYAVPVEFGPYVETQLDPALKAAATAAGFESGPRTRSPQAAQRDPPAGLARALLVLLLSSRPSWPYYPCSLPPCRS